MSETRLDELKKDAKIYFVGIGNGGGVKCI